METVTLNSKAQKRAFVLHQVNRGDLTAEAASEVLGISVRQLRRILAAYRKEGLRAYPTATVVEHPHIGPSLRSRTGWGS